MILSLICGLMIFVVLKKLAIGRVQAVYSNKDVGFAKKNTSKSFVETFNTTFLQLHNAQGQSHQSTET